EHSTLSSHAHEQPGFDDGCLHAGFRGRAEASVRTPSDLLHRPSRLRAAHPRVRVCRDHSNRTRNNRTQSRGSQCDRGLDYRAPLDRIHGADFSVNQARLPTGLVFHHFQIFVWRICLSTGTRGCGRRDLLHPSGHAMKTAVCIAIALTNFSATVFPADRHMAFERNNAVYIANLDGTNEKKIADGIFPAISPDGERVAFNTVEKTSDTTYARHMAVADVATIKVTVFKDVPSENSYYPSWSADGKQIFFTTRPHEVWDLAAIDSDGTNFRVLKPGVQNEVTCYSPVWAHDGQSVFCQDMTNIYQIGLDGSVRAQWKINKIVPNGDMSGDGRIDVSPDGQRLLLSIDMGEESGRKDWDGPLPALWAFDLQSQKATRLTSKKLFGWDGAWIDNDNILFLSRADGEKDDSIYRMSADGKNLKRLIKNARFPSFITP